MYSIRVLSVGLTRRAEFQSPFFTEQMDMSPFGVY
jgi:hypothetical protein